MINFALVRPIVAPPSQSIFSAIKRVQPLKPQGDDVVARVVDEGNHATTLINPARSPRPVPARRCRPDLQGEAGHLEPEGGKEPRLTSRSICE